jgi:hypothetical protein
MNAMAAKCAHSTATSMKVAQTNPMKARKLSSTKDASLADGPIGLLLTVVAAKSVGANYTIITVINQ